MFEDWGVWTWTFFVSEWIIRLIMVFVVPARRPPAAARTWLLLILFEPYLGLALFWLIGSRRLPRWRQKMLAKRPAALGALRECLDRHPGMAHPELPPELQPAVALAEHLGQMPILGGNAAELLGDYQGIIDRLVADIDAARHHVHLLYYIFANDRTAARVMDALARAARRGVTCRVLVDSLASRKYFSALCARLCPAGIRVEESLPVGWWRLLRWSMARIDLRNHRKLAVIDGCVGYCGSQNIIDAKFHEGLTYDELMVRVAGPVVLELQFVFAEDWFIETEEVLDGRDYFPEPSRQGAVAAQALPSGPGQPTENNQRLFVALIHGARKRITMTTPYFVPDEPILQALQTAVLRGVEVHLIVSEKADQLLVSQAQRSFYGEMLEDGIHIHEYRRRFLHAKHLSIDDEVALIGSSNMDIRSFELNNEILLIFYDRDVTLRLHREEAGYLRNCITLDAARWARRSFLRKVIERMARLLSPVL